MKSTLNIRVAESADSSFAAPLICLSLHELADHLFQLNTEAIETMIAKLFVRDAGRFGYNNAFVAECEKEPVGLLIACRGDKVNRLNIETIPHLVAVLGLVKAIGFVYRAITLPGGKEAQDDEFFLSNLGVIPSMQGRSLGTQMLAYAERLACENDLRKCSLIVGWNNVKARRLYERLGYQVVETVQYKNETLGYYRMVKVL